MRILVTGSRDFDDELVVYDAMRDIDFEFDLGPGRAVVVHGGATGADRIAERAGFFRGWQSEPHLPDFEQYGSPHAYHVRNREMVEAGAGVVLAFFKKGAKNAGTTRTVELAEAAGLPVRRFEA